MLQIYAPLSRLTQANVALWMEFMSSAEVADEVRENVSSAIRTASSSAVKLCFGPAFAKLMQGLLSNHIHFLTATSLGRDAATESPWLPSHEREEAPAWPMLSTR